MKFERRRNQQHTRRLGEQFDAREVTVSTELAPVEVPLHSHPVVQRLQRQMDVLASLQLDYRQSPASLHRKQIQDAAIGCGKGRDLVVNWSREQSGVDRASHP